ncbi:hypothetical protein BC939DRAFT_452446, partial [Gamsiella multidivaricata]|uniref:uncharacterized protein n=1 Tax=Gamsiella multidivaricata TaxID=101098 RepID=UPI00221E762A
MEDISIFAIPHLKDEVTQYLTRCDLAQCSLVSKQWSSWFTPTLWHTINRRHPQIESSTLIKYRDHIRELIGVDTAFASKDDLWPLPNLRRLEQDNGHSLFTMVESNLRLLRLLQMTELFFLRTLKLELFLDLESVQARLLETLLHLPQLKKLDLQSRKHASPIYIQQLIQTCSRLDSLTLGFESYDEDLNEKSMARRQAAKRAMELMPVTRLRELKYYFEQPDQERALLPSLLRRCPLLESLDIRPIRGPRALKEIMSVFEDGACPRLKRLCPGNTFFVKSFEGDVGLLRPLARKRDSNYTGNDTWNQERQCGLESFAVVNGNFESTLALALVEYHSTTLTSLKAPRTTIHLSDLATLLSGLPRLQSLVTRVDLAERLDLAECMEAALQKQWVCLGLKHLSLTWKGGSKDMRIIRERHVNSMTNRCMHYIFEQVGRLIELEEWTLEREFELLYLSDGFLIWLSGLKRMKSLVYEARQQDQQLDAVEAEWMIENWPALIHIVLRGVNGNKLSKEGQLAEDQFKATLKERRPWIHI